jgi:sterol desaturase/sphingolipid hydroxylase (fatty acid hydroxylase superfamily)
MLKALHAKSAKRKQMSNISPLQLVLLKVLRNATLGAVFLLIIFLAITIWQQSKPSGFDQFTRQDWSFTGLLVVMLLCALWLYRAIGREMNNPGA